MRFSAPIELIHQSIPGRVRIRVFAIYRHEGIKAELEQKIGQFAHVESVMANALTGSILILFDPAHTAGILADLESAVG